MRSKNVVQPLGLVLTPATRHQISEVVLAVVASWLFAATAAAKAYDVLHSFEAASPTGLIQGTDGNLYGTTAAGTIFKIDTTGTTLKTIHSFSSVGSDGAKRCAGLIQGTDGNLYGTTYQGSASDDCYQCGTIFKIDTNGKRFTTLHIFVGSDGAKPRAALIQGTDGNLYGTTSGGGASDSGTIFRIDTNGTTLTTLHSFAVSDGAGPGHAGLIEGTDGNLYGTTDRGGSSGHGTIFKIDTNGRTFTTLHSFDVSEGAHPFAGLIQGTDGNLYGTTFGGGANGLGTSFKTDTNGSRFTTLHSFSGSDGARPSAGLIQGTDGNFYGTTYQGAASGYGAIFKIDVSGDVTTLHSFAGSDGRNPDTALILATDGHFYGTTGSGGDDGGGVVFRLAGGDSATATEGQSVTVSTAPAMAGYAGVIALLTNNSSGTATVTSHGFPSDPGTAGIVDVGGRYVDLKVTGADLADTVATNFYYPTTISGSNEVNLQLFYFARSAWNHVRSSGNFDPDKNTTDSLDGTVSGGRFATVFDSTSIPRITELAGTVFTFSVAVRHNVCLPHPSTRCSPSARRKGKG